MKSDLVDVEVEIRDQRGKAIAVYAGRHEHAGETGTREAWVWLPLSQIEIEEADGSSGIATITMPRWLAKDKGLI